MLRPLFRYIPLAGAVRLAITQVQTENWGTQG